MNFIKTVSLFTILFLSVQSSHAQTPKVIQDLLDQLEKTHSDSLKGVYCKKLSSKYLSRDLKKSKAFAQQSYQYFGKINFVEGQAKAANLKGWATMYLGEIDTSILNYTKSIELYESVGNYEKSTSSYSGISYCYERQGKLVEALKTVQKSLQVANDHSVSEKQKGNLLVDLGRIYRLNNQFDKAIATYQRSLKIALKNKDHSSAGVIYMNTGNVYVQKDELKTATDYYLKSIAENKLCKCAGKIGPIWTNMGSLYYNLEDPKNMAIAIKNAERHTLDKNNIDFKIDIVSLKGMLAQLKEDHEEALKHLKIAKNIAVSNQLTAKEVEIDGLLQISYLALGDKEKANEILKEALAVKDSLHNENIAGALAEMEVKYQTSENEKKLAISQLESKLKEQDLQSAKLRNNWLIVILLSFLIMGAIIAFLLRKSNSNRRLLAEKNEELHELVDQKQLLLKEIHHRVKNNLQMVSSLLNLQTRSSNNQEIINAMLEGQSRLKSISILHQKLYERDLLSDIEMDDYIAELSSYLVKNFNVHDKPVEIKTDALGLKLDMDIALPIGLIINELITNILKYAISDLETGKIHIAIQKGKIPDQYTLNIAHNGIGLPDNINIGELKSMGLKLVNSLSKQIGGSFEHSNEPSAQFNIHFTSKTH